MYVSNLDIDICLSLGNANVNELEQCFVFQMLVRCVLVIVTVAFATDSIMILPGAILMCVVYKLQRIHVKASRSINFLDMNGNLIVHTIIRRHLHWNYSLLCYGLICAAYTYTYTNRLVCIHMLFKIRNSISIKTKFKILILFPDQNFGYFGTVHSVFPSAQSCMLKMQVECKNSFRD
jgi:hypothetical protein